MPAVVDISKMQVGEKGKGKHWTKREVEARKAAAKKTARKKLVRLKPPAWLKDDPAAFKIWKGVLKGLKDVELLDALDAHALATYCKLEAEKAEVLKKDNMDLVRFERLSSLSLSYAKSLGLTPESRARLARKRAEGEKDPNADLFD